MNKLDTLYSKISDGCFEAHSRAEGLCEECAKLFAMMSLGVTLDELCKRYFKMRLVRSKIESELEEFWIGEKTDGRIGNEKSSGEQLERSPADDGATPGAN